MSADNSSNNNRAIILLFVLILSVILAGGYFWINQNNGSLLLGLAGGGKNRNDASKPAKLADTTKIETAGLLDVNFWEARINTSYSLERQYGKGYLSLTMKEWAFSGVIGLVTTPGEHEGIVIVNRHLNSPKAYSSKTLRGRMYDPYRSSHNYYEGDFNIDLNWPSVDDIDVNPGENKNKFAEVKKVFIYRNVPNYIEFAKSLVEGGFYPERISMLLAVCPGCQGSLIFGEDIPVDSLQVVLKQLEIFEFPLGKVEFSEKISDIGVIRIGQSPSKNSTPLWSNYDALTQPGISLDDFLSIIGFERKSDEDRAVALHKRAKELINNGNRKKMAEARKLLDRAQELDSDYIPIYIELSRYLLRSSADYNMYYPTETGFKAQAILKNSLKINPDYSNTYVLLGMVQTSLHEFDKAKSSFQKAKDLGTDNLWLHYNLAFWHEQQNDLSLSIKELQYLLKHEIDHSDNDRAYKSGLNRLTKHYIKTNNYSGAREIFERLRNDFPRFMTPLEGYIKFLLAYTDDRKRAEELFEDVKSRGCNCYERILTMMAIVNSFESLSISNGEVLKHLIRAQSTKASFARAVAELGKGENGQTIIRGLLNSTLLKIEEIEASESLLSYVMDTNNIEAQRFFLENGASPNSFDLDKKFTPLMLAISRNNSDLVKLFLEYDADPHLESSVGFSAYDLSIKMGNEELLGEHNKTAI